ncbi:hypothetical protein BB561_002795 [Smittium simulii]|uniref:RRM domain-containing protein n=1 Tax=Smittium simulii TaxID=133385 RepID=A0A2T9YP32_9FUNG|nr:hypothetical protein BB561_002795 [Smittium simulii]
MSDEFNIEELLDAPYKDPNFLKKQDAFKSSKIFNSGLELSENLGNASTHKLENGTESSIELGAKSLIVDSNQSLDIASSNFTGEACSTLENFGDYSDNQQVLESKAYPFGANDSRKVNIDHDGKIDKNNLDYKEDKKTNTIDKSPQLTDLERDQRTVFVMQLARNLRTRELFDFFSSCGKVRKYAIKAVEMSGKKLLGIPILVQFSEAEKNRQVNIKIGLTAQVEPKSRCLCISGIPTTLEENDLRMLFEPFGAIELCSISTLPTGNPSDKAYIQYYDPSHADLAADKMDGFELLGCRFRVFTTSNREQTPNMTAFLPHKQAQSSRMPQIDSQNDTIERIDTYAGSQMNRLESLRLAGFNVPNSVDMDKKVIKISEPPVTQLEMKTECLLLTNMFNPEIETEPNWSTELEEEIHDEVCKFGEVTHIKLNPNSKGDVYLRFKDAASAGNAHNELNGRWFGGFQIHAKFMDPAEYSKVVYQINV